MTDTTSGHQNPNSARPRRNASLSPVAVRLAGAVLAITFGALAVLATLVLVFARSDVSALSRDQQDELARASAAAAAAAYRSHRSWVGTDLSAALAPVLDTGSRAAISDIDGHTVAAVAPFGSRPLNPRLGSSAPVIVDGEQVGTVTVVAGPGGFSVADRRLRDALTVAILGSAGLTAAATLIVAVMVTRRITRPVLALAEAARALGAGHRQVRVGGNRGPGELGELAHAFDTMADNLDRQDHLRRALIADVAHELRTPVAILQASCEALADGIADPTPDMLSGLRDEALRLTLRIEDLESLASAEAAGLTMTHELVDLAAVARDAVHALTTSFETAGQTITSDLQPVIVIGDQRRLHQIITNLLVNASKFTPPGGQICIKTGPDADGLARLEVADTGPGIAPDELARVFDRFWRGRHQKAIAGSGIGLAIVDELARAHGGTAQATSPKGHGALFIVTLPRASIASA
jgi:two-component system sensor histidine kinase BaeS